MQNKLMQKILVGSLCLFSSACGSDDESIIKDFIFDVTGHIAEVQAEFAADIEISTELSIPIKDYGFIDLLPADGAKGFRLGIRLDTDILSDSDIGRAEKTRFLPNGQRMSRYIETELASVIVKRSEKIISYLYLGLEVENFYLGTALSFLTLDHKFPSGLVISQRIRDDDKNTLGVISFYGPKMEDGKTVHPGGLFLATNVSALARLIRKDEFGHDSKQVVPISSSLEDLTVSGPNAKKYRKPRKLYKLMKKFVKALKKAQDE